ncbi:MAG TPA: hypothetical protein VK324_02660, partial [Tepidisphaeraceae bacterium]|nr:hypothetical protein [Tepidisphaeraceae bacterium]
APWRAATMPLAMLAAWVVLGVAIFWVVTPASSAWLWRYTLPVQGPAAVLVGVLAAVAARAVAPRWAAVAPAVLLAAFLVRPKSLFTDLATPPPYEQQPLVQAIEHLRTLDLEPGARVYAVPTQHLPLTFYTGMAVQSIAPVRRSFLETYPHEIVLLDPVPRRVRVTPAAVSAGAREAGVSVSDADARRAAAVATHRSALNAVAGNVARAVDGDPAAEPLPPYATNLLRRPPLPSPAAEGSGRWQNPAIFRGHEAHEMTDFWPTYFYRFVDPAARTGANANYAGRLRNATATLLSNGWLAYRSPGAVAERAEGGKAEPPGNEGRP